jgi:hypothetical protein
MNRRLVDAAGGALIVLLALLLGSSGTNPDPGPPDDTEAIRAYLLEAFQRHKALDLAYAQAMPDSAWRWAPADGVRDYAQQIAHIAHDFFTPWRGEHGPSADSAAYLNDRSVMLEQIEEGWDWAIGNVEAMAAAELTEEIEFMGGQVIPRWRASTYWIEHAMWTRGSVVPYLRMNGVTPPPIGFFTTE